MTAEEKVEQAKLREEYIEGYRRSVRHHIEGIKIVDEDGNEWNHHRMESNRII